MRINSLKVRPLAGALAAALTLSAVAPMAPRPEPSPIKVKASESTHSVDVVHDFTVPSNSTHIAIHWPGHPDASVTAAFSKDGKRFAEPEEVELDEGGDVGGEDAETYGVLMGVDGISVVRVTTDRPITDVSVLALDAAGEEAAPLGLGSQAAGATGVPTVIPRSAWGADESLRFDWAGDELWPQEFFPLQMMVVHHTAGRNADPNPYATVRAIYYYHAVTKGWGDIGYNYLIDGAGRVYEGRFARDFWNGATPSSDNAAGLALAGGHAKHFNLGSMGIALMGTFSSTAPTTAARASLVRMLAWAAAKYRIDPRGSSTYVNPQTGATRRVANIDGHRVYQATGCPGGVLYGLLPTIRSQVAAATNTWPGEVYNPPRTLTFAAGTYTGRKFNAVGALVESKTYTLPKASNAPTNQKAVVPLSPPQGWNWYYITAGVWAGYWMRESSSITISAPRAQPTVEEFETARPLTVPAGTYVGRRFNTHGAITASKSASLAAGSVLWTTQRSTIPANKGRWWYVTVGPLEGYWVPEAPGMALGAPPPPIPTPIAAWEPDRTLWFAPGTYVGRRYSQYGVLAGTKSYTLSRASSAPTRRLSTLPGQQGNWYYIVDGVWDAYWILEQPGVTLAPLAPSGGL